MTIWFPNRTESAPAVPPHDMTGWTAPRLRTAFVASFASAAQMPGESAAWRALQARSAEANVFFDSDFVLAAFRHLRTGDQPMLLLVRDTARSAPDDLVGLLPFVAEPAAGSRPAFGCWRNPYTALGAPLVDQAHVEGVLRAMLEALQQRYGGETILALRALDREGPIAAALQKVAQDSRRPFGLANGSRRAMLLPHGADVDGRAVPASARRRKEMNRLRRRLEEAGRLSFSPGLGYDGARAALERFFHLEVAGWKGGRGTALLQDPGLAAFARTAIWNMAKADKARVAELRLDGVTIASCIVLIFEQTAFLWKIAYDETFAKYGPGVLLIDWLGAALTQEGIVAVDSCALQGNAMIESLWSGRRHLADAFIAAAPQATIDFDQMIEAEAQRAQWRARAKHAYHRLRGWTH